MKTWEVVFITKRTTVRGYATLADGMITVTRNGASDSTKSDGWPEEEALDLLRGLYLMELQQSPSRTKQ